MRSACDADAWGAMRQPTRLSGGWALELGTGCHVVKRGSAAAAPTSDSRLQLRRHQHLACKAVMSGLCVCRDEAGSAMAGQVGPQLRVSGAASPAQLLLVQRWLQLWARDVAAACNAGISAGVPRGA